MTPMPGDFAVVSMGGQGGALISAMEGIAYDHSTHWDHAFVYVGGDMIVQAEPAGAQKVPLGAYRYTIWSSGILFPSAAQRTAIVAAAEKFAADKIPYSYLDYAALAAHRFHFPFPGLKDYIADTGHEICSQAVDQIWLAGGYHLFTDDRWPGYVTPYDLGTLLEHHA